MRILPTLSIQVLPYFNYHNIQVGIYWEYDKSHLAYFKDGMLNLSDVPWKELIIDLSIPTLTLRLRIISWSSK